MIDVAIRAARAAGKILVEHYGKLPDEAVRKKSQNDFLSFVDEQSEKTIISIIKEAFPNHSILAEESGNFENTSSYRWIIDPLDGTTNYISNIPVFAISIGLQKDDELILGVVYDPLKDELFHAEKSGGAFLNDHPIRVSGKHHLNECLVATGFPFKARQFMADYIKAFHDMLDQSLDKRRLGAAAIDLAYVACGRFEGFWEIGLAPWDIAAGALLIKEAGGQVSDFWNNPQYLHNNYIVASNGHIHQQMMEIVQHHFPFYQTVYPSKGE